MTRGI
ncbi:hypothetical protein CP061683_0453A, partial [Chlamydia psittaci 06-1683]